MIEPQQTASNIEDASRSNLGIMAAAAEHIAAGAGPAASDHHSPNSATVSPALRPKLVLPKLTPAMQQDLAMTKNSSAKASKPLSIGARPEYADYALQNIVTPHPNDVLCGRGGGSNNHPGNESFRELVNEVKFPYVNCPKREKPLIARRIVEAVRNQTPPGRFLSKNSKTALWNDIGDGKAREKTSQALREGAPIIREHMIGKPTSPPTNVAEVLKKAKKAERAEKECGMRLPRKSPKSEAAKAVANAPVTHHGNAYVCHAQSKNEPVLIQHGGSIGDSSPHNSVIRNGGHMPPLKMCRSFPVEQEISNGPLPPTTWPPIQHQHQQPGRNFNVMPYGHHPGHMIGGYAPPHPGPADYPSGGGDYPSGRGMPRYPSTDSVPLETVRQLLLNQLDPVQLAVQILPPDEAAAVFQRHNRSPAGPPPQSHHPGSMMGGSIRGGAPPPILAVPQGAPTHPLKLNAIVSDGSSSMGDVTAAGAPVRRFASHSDHGAGHTPDRGFVGGGDDGSSVDSARRSDTSERVLPKKKRKYVDVVSSTWGSGKVMCESL